MGREGQLHKIQVKLNFFVVVVVDREAQPTPQTNKV